LKLYNITRTGVAMLLRPSSKQSWSTTSSLYGSQRRHWPGSL